MKIYDISMNIRHDMAVFNNKDSRRPVSHITRDRATGGDVYESRVDIEMHTGTHIDAPLHMIDGGDTIENLDLSKVFRKCRVVDLTNLQDCITADDLADKVINSGEFILFKTRNSFTEDFDPGFVFLEKGGAEYLKSKGITGVGTDSLGIERSQPGHETHKILMGAGIVIVEGLRLKDIEEGEYLLCALPLKIDGAEGAPARAVLVKEE